MLGIWWAIFSWLPYFTGYWGKIHFLFSLPLMFGFAVAYLLPWQISFISRETIAFILSVPIGIFFGYLCSLIVYELYQLQARR
jgi:hypothetical protein